MKLCDNHHKLLTGDGECFACTIENYQLKLDRVTADKNLGNHVIAEQKKEIAQLKAQIAELENKYQFVVSE